MKAVLGIHVGHDASACLIIDGHIKLAIQEERFSRVKNHTGFPFKSLKKIKSYLIKKSIEEIYLAVAQDKLTLDIDANLPILLARLFSYKYPRFLNKSIYLVGKVYDLIFKKTFLSEIIWRKVLILRTSFLLDAKINKVNFYDHHKCCNYNSYL